MIYDDEQMRSWRKYEAGFPFFFFFKFKEVLQAPDCEREGEGLCLLESGTSFPGCPTITKRVHIGLVIVRGNILRQASKKGESGSTTIGQVQGHSSRDRIILPPYPLALSSSPSSRLPPATSEDGSSMPGSRGEFDLRRGLTTPPASAH